MLNRIREPHCEFRRTYFLSLNRKLGMKEGGKQGEVISTFVHYARRNETGKRVRVRARTLVRVYREYTPSWKLKAREEIDKRNTQRTMA